LKRPAFASLLKNNRQAALRGGLSVSRIQLLIRASARDAPVAKNAYVDRRAIRASADLSLREPGLGGQFSSAFCCCNHDD
jgi:hypothetical protein